MDALFYKDTMYGGGGVMRGNYFDPIIYSTEERVVGVWTNNKPLYQKTFAFQLTGATSYLDLSPYDVEEIIHEEERAVLDNGLYTLNLPYYENATYSVFTNYIKENMNALAFYAGSGIVTYYSNIIVTLQYTKTTDVAGSGKYNTLGVPNVHYTTDEQVIGTWIDGKPLYQKTIAIHNESTVSSDTTITTIDSTFRVKNWKAFAIENGVNYKIPYVAGNGNASFFFRENGNVEFTIRNTSFAVGSDFYITIEYTKTTD